MDYKVIRPMPQFDEGQLPALCAEFAEEDRELAEEGRGAYGDALREEDRQ